MEIGGENVAIQIRCIGRVTIDSQLVVKDEADHVTAKAQIARTTGAHIEHFGTDPPANGHNEADTAVAEAYSRISGEAVRFIDNNTPSNYQGPAAFPDDRDYA